MMPEGPGCSGSGPADIPQGMAGTGFAMISPYQGGIWGPSGEFWQETPCLPLMLICI